MANIMNEVSFKNNVSRNGFDKSQKIAFTAKTGELLPTLVEEVIPGDKFKINLQAMTRTMPIQTAAYTRIREYYDFYFVPYRLLWRYAPDFLTQMPNTNSASSSSNPIIQHDYLPYFTMYDIADAVNYMGASQDIFGNYRQLKSRKLLSYLGYGVTPSSADDVADYYEYDMEVNPFPILAYQKIYNDYFRDQQWEKSDPTTFNIDYVTGSSVNLDPMDYVNVSAASQAAQCMFDMRYANYHKDMFFGLLPNPQFGDEALATPLQGSFAAQLEFGGSGFQPSGINEVSITPNVSSQFNSSGLSVLALRQAEFLQKWKEIAQSGRQDYKSQIQKHFGVNVPDVLSNRCLYLGGTSTQIDIDGVTNNNLADGNEANIAGRGIGTNGGYVDFEAKEHGIIMCIYHNLPLLDYKDIRLSPLVTKLEATDFAIPEFDKAGMQPVNIEHFVYGQNDSVLSVPSSSPILGYAPRYVDYKTSTDVVRGEFLYTMNSWVAPIQNIIADLLKNRAAYSEWFSWLTFKVNPTILDSIFYSSANDSKFKGEQSAVDYMTNHPLGSANDQFLINSFYDVKVVRNLDRNGLPY